MKSTKLKIWKQDPKVKYLGISEILLPFEVGEGPSDDDVEIIGARPVKPMDGNFLLDPKAQMIEFDAVHTYGVVRQVLGVIRRALNRNGKRNNVEWHWGTERLKVIPHAGEAENAKYVRAQKAIKFYYFKPKHCDFFVYTCRSFDIIAHELGHAVLDAIQPGYWQSTEPETAALHEAFGDLTAIFTLLSQFDICERLIIQTKGDLRQKNFLSSVAEEFGAARGDLSGLRNVDNTLKVSDIPDHTNMHSFSRVFTGAVYDILVDIFASHRDVNRFDLTESLHRVGEHLVDLVLMAIYTGPKENARFKDIANRMLELETKKSWRAIIENHFTYREILGVASLASSKRKRMSPEDWNHSCHDHDEESESI